MEHTISLHDSTPEPSPEPFEVSSSYETYEEPTPLHAFVAAEPVSDGWVQEEVPAEEYEPTVAAEHDQHDQYDQHSQHAEHAQYDEHHEQHQHHEAPEIHVVPEVEPVAEAPQPTGERRVVLQMTDGQTVELRRMWDADEAVAFARDTVRRIAAAEAAGEWPDLDGRFLRPDSIFSVDVQVGD